MHRTQRRLFYLPIHTFPLQGVEEGGARIKAELAHPISVVQKERLSHVPAPNLFGNGVDDQHTGMLRIVPEGKPGVVPKKLHSIQSDHVIMASVSVGVQRHGKVFVRTADHLAGVGFLPCFHPETFSLR